MRTMDGVHLKTMDAIAAAAAAAAVEAPHGDLFHWRCNHRKGKQMIQMMQQQTYDPFKLTTSEGATSSTGWKHLPLSHTHTKEAASSYCT
jgi:hypothetical protein